MKRFTEILKKIAKYSANYEHFVNQAKEHFLELYDKNGICELDAVLKDIYHLVQVSKKSAEGFVDNKTEIRWHAFLHAREKHVMEYLQPTEVICIGCSKIFIDSWGGLASYCSRDCFRKSKKETKPEYLIKKWLMQEGYPFEQEKRIDLDSVWTFVDFFIEPNLCLYVDGNYYHGDDFPEHQERDKRNNILLSMYGYVVVRIAGRDVVKGKRPDFGCYSIQNLKKPPGY